MACTYLFRCDLCGGETARLDAYVGTDNGLSKLGLHYKPHNGYGIERTYQVCNDCSNDFEKTLEVWTAKRKLLYTKKT